MGGVAVRPPCRRPAGFGSRVPAGANHTALHAARKRCGQTKIPDCSGILGVPKLGVEPRRLYSHYALTVARLPIPPLRLALRVLFGSVFLSTCKLLANLWTAPARASLKGNML